jgi:hypothetical protein
MARRKISAMTPATELNPSDTFEVVQGGTNKSVTRQVASALPIVDHTDVLTFDQSEEMDVVTAGTHAFTLSATGNVNGLGKIAKLNEPVSATFSADFELGEDSNEVSTSHMNLIVFNYFANYDGNDNPKVIYFVKRQTAL